MKETVTKSGKKSSGPGPAAASRKTGLAKKISAALAPAKAKPAGASKAAAKPASRPAAKAAAAPLKKAAAAKPAAKVASKAAAQPVKTAQKAAPKAALKAVAKKAAPTTAAKAAPKAAPKKVVKAAPKAASKTTAAAAPKAAAKAIKAVAATAARPAVKAKRTPAPQADEAGMKKTVEQQAVKASETGARTNAVAGATAELADKMKTSVVSKVSEVMTKTTKPTPAPNTEGRLLSEDEIRAMSEKDYMNPAQLAFFKARLQQLEKDLLKNAGETTEHLRETVLVPDPADRATIEEEHALELRTRDRERKLLKKVQQSIAAIDAGDYGWCEETGEPIGIPRLIARPTATLSLEAQQRRELKQKLYGD
jgi:DnaK suppressor protein